MTESSTDRNRSTHRLRLPAPGVSAIVIGAVVLVSVALTCWWPYHCEQQVLRQLQARHQVEITWKYVGPELLRPWSDRQWMVVLRRVQVLRVDNRDTWRGGIATVVRTTSPENTLAPIPDLSPLRQCTRLELSGLLVNGPECLRGAASCERLATLRLNDCQVSSDTLRGLDGIPALREIRMESCSVPGDLLQLPQASSFETFRGDRAMFRRLDVSGTPEIRRIEAKNCSFSDEGAAMLLEAPHLEVLMVPNGRLTDNAIGSLLELRALRYLDVRHNGELTRDGLSRLAELPSLQTVNVYRTAADAELGALQRVLPQAKSTYSP